MLLDMRPLQGPSAVRGVGSYARGLLKGLINAVLRRLGGVKAAAPAVETTQPTRKTRPSRVERSAPRYEAEPRSYGTPRIMRDER